MQLQVADTHTGKFSVVCIERIHKCGYE